MNPVAPTIKRLRKVRSNRNEIVLRIIRKNEGIIIAVQEEQMFEGKRSTGKKIGEYRPLTKRIKLGKGQPIDRVTLKDTGEFYEGLKISYENDHFFITSDDPKTEAIIEQYGENVFGLMFKNWKELEKMIIGDIKTYLDSRLWQ